MSLDIQDIITSVSVPSLVLDEFIRRGSFAKLRNGDVQAYVGGFSVVFPVIVNGEKWAYRCWHIPIDDAYERYRLIGNYLETKKLPYFCSFSYTQQGVVVNGQKYPTTKMRWADGVTLKEYICKNCYSPNKLLALAAGFLEMCKTLHENHIAHGDLQHGNIIVSPSGRLYLVDYDSLYVPTMGNRFRDSISGLVDYQHPKRKSNRLASEKLDYFSELVIYLSLLAIAEKPNLVNAYQVEDTECLLFKASDFSNFSNSSIYRDLMGLSDSVRFYTQVLESYLYDSLIENLDPITDTRMCQLRVAALDEKKWSTIQNSNSKKDFTDYLKRFPHGNHAQAAKSRISKIDEEERIQKARLQKKQEEDDWLSAVSNGGLYALEKYVYKYPHGAHIKEAQKKIDKIKNPPDEANRVIIGVLAMIAVIVVICIAVNKNSGSTPQPTSSPAPTTTQKATPSSNKTKSSSTIHINNSAEIAEIKQSLDSRLPGMEQAKREGLTPAGINNTQKKINRLKELNDPSWKAYQNRLDKLK